MPITIGIGIASMARRTQPVSAQRDHEEAGGEKGADHLGEAQMGERGADQHGAGDGPEECERLAIGETVDDADDAVDEERAEHPRCKVGFAQAAPGAGRQHDRHRPGRRKQEGDGTVADMGRGQIAPEPGGDTAAGRSRAMAGAGAVDTGFVARRAIIRYPQARAMGPPDDRFAPPPRNPAAVHAVRTRPCHSHAACCRRLRAPDLSKADGPASFARQPPRRLEKSRPTARSALAGRGHGPGVVRGSWNSSKGDMS